jgi:hypothetical protein
VLVVTGRQRPVLAVHVEHDHVRVREPGGALEHQRDGPALAGARAAEQRQVPLEQLVAVGDSGGALVGDEASEAEAFALGDVLAEDRHEAQERLAFDHVAAGPDRRERVGAAHEAVAVRLRLDQRPDQAQLDDAVGGHAGDERDQALAGPAAAGGDEVVDGDACNELRVVGLDDRRARVDAHDAPEARAAEQVDRRAHPATLSTALPDR